MTPIIKIQSCDFSYIPSDPVLEEVNLTVDPGEFASIIGPNGGGKTTLVRLILGLLTPKRGSVSLFGGPPAQNRLWVGYTPQQLQVDRLFPISVLDVVLTGCLGNSFFDNEDDDEEGKEPSKKANPRSPRRGDWRETVRSLLFRYRSGDRSAARRALEKMGLAPLEKKAFGDLSGGERQRVLIARAICAGPKLLILDEPTNNIDPEGSEILYRLLEELNKTTAVLIVSHDLGVVSRYVRSVICVNRRVVVHPTSMLDGRAIRELYGSDQRLVRHDHRCSELGHRHLSDP